jgi:acetolactate synthase I/II/III large subunit
MRNPNRVAGGRSIVVSAVVNRDAGERMADELVAALAANGVGLMFGLPGGGSNLDVVGAAERGGLRFVLTHGETAAATMAGVAAELTGLPSACLVTRGPGVSSAANGIAQALLDRQPVVVISDCVEQAERDRVSHQRIDQQALMATVTKASLRFGPHDHYVPARAVALASGGRPGPVHIDFDSTAMDRSELVAQGGTHAPVFARGWEDVVRAARRPVIVAGVGATAIPAARRAATRAALDHLVTSAPIPVLTTYKARGAVADGSPSAAGIATGASAEGPLLDAADVIMGIGLDPVELIPEPWPYAAPVVLLGSWPIDDSTYFGDRLVGQVVGDLATLVDELAGAVDPRWSTGDAQRYRALALGRIEAAVPADPVGLTPQQVVTIARAAAPAGAIATVDAGAHMLAAVPLWEVDAPGQLLISNGLATMGFALPAAAAAAIVDPSRPVICFTGDGGISITLAELETLARLRLGVVVVVFNDAALSLIAIKQATDGQGGPAAVSYAPNDFAAVAAGFGIRSERVVDVDSYRAAIEAALHHDGPSLLDVMVDPSSYPAILASIRGGASPGD